MTTKKNTYFIYITLLLIIHLVLLYFIKYSNQHLPLTEFRFDYFGNLISLIIILFLILGIYINSKKQFVYPSKIKINYYVGLIYLSLLSGFLSTLINLPFKSVYIFQQPANKVFIGFIFMVYQLIIFMFLSSVWSGIITKSYQSIFRSLVNGILILFISFVLIFIYISQRGLSGKEHALNKNASNIAVVLGAAVWSSNKPSPRLASRVDKAIELYKHNFVSKILLTGSNAPGEMSEASVAYNYALENGINKNIFQIEESTTSTTEQIAYIKYDISLQEGVGDIVLISDAFHISRIIEISKFYNVKIKVAASNLKMGFEDMLYSKLRECLALFVFWCFAL